MTFLLYIGKNKDFLRKFSKLENVQMIYAQNYQDAITICIRLKVRENIIVLHEQGEMNGDIEQIGAFRKKVLLGICRTHYGQADSRSQQSLSEQRNKRYRQFEHHHRPVKAENRHHQ